MLHRIFALVGLAAIVGCGDAEDPATAQRNADALALCEATSDLGCNMLGSVLRCARDIAFQREHFVSRVSNTSRALTSGPNA